MVMGNSWENDSHGKNGSSKYSTKWSKFYHENMHSDAKKNLKKSNWLFEIYVLWIVYHFLGYFDKVKVFICVLWFRKGKFNNFIENKLISLKKSVIYIRQAQGE